MSKSADKIDLLAVEISPEDVADSGWLEEVEALGGEECEAGFEPLFKRAEELKREGRVGSAAWVFLIGAICSFTVSTEPGTPTFRPYMIMGSSRSPSPDDLTDHHLDLLAAALPTIPMHGLSARAGDLLWTLRQDHRAAMLAIDKYLEPAKSLARVESWPHPMHWLDRALQLGATLGRRNEGFQNASALLTQLLANLDLAQSDNRAVKLVELSFKYGVDVPADLAERCALAATKAAKDGAWHRARSFWEAGARLERADNAEAASGYMLSVAESYVSEAESAVASDEDYLVGATLLQSAIAALRELPGISARVFELHGRLLEWQSKATERMNSFSQRIDLSKPAAAAREFVSGRSMRDAIASLVLLYQPPTVEELRARVEESADKYVFMNVFPKVITDHAGKVVRQVPSLLTAAGEDREEAVRSHMVTEADFHRELVVHGQIDPARERMMLEHPIDEEALVELVEASPFVPRGREEIFRRGLAAGFRGDFLTSTHLLVPELENSLRYQLRLSGGIASRIKTDGTQPERMLPDLLKEAGRAGMFPEDLVFDLESLLVEQGGPNLRHQLAHGMLEYHEYFSPSAQYLWWSMLRLCVLPLIRMKPPEDELPVSRESDKVSHEELGSDATAGGPTEHDHGDAQTVEEAHPDASCAPS
jgi:hypothetical protein